MIPHIENPTETTYTKNKLLEVTNELNLQIQVLLNNWIKKVKKVPFIIAAEIIKYVGIM